jgi:hypothetical protein
LLKKFSPIVEQEMTVVLEPALEEEVDNMDFVELYDELESLERGVNMKIGISSRSIWRQVEEHTSLGRRWKKLELNQHKRR